MGKTKAKLTLTDDLTLELTNDMLATNDQIDNAAFRLAQALCPVELEWDIAWIGEIVDAAKEILIRHGFEIHHPGIQMNADGTQEYGND